MAIDPRRLRPSQFVQLLNSTPLGEVVSERTIYRHRARAGLRIGDGQHIDLLKYVAWLVFERHRPRPEPEGLTGYDAQKERARQRSAMLSLSGRDIGELPAVANPERRVAGERDFRRFCDEYLSSSFVIKGRGHLPWSSHHLEAMRLIEVTVLEGGQYAYAMPRGFAKTGLCEAAGMWAILYAHHNYAVIIGPAEKHALDRISNIKTELEHNDLLLADFPEVCYPIRRLEGINQRRLIYHDRLVFLEFTKHRIILADIPGSRAAGSVISTTSITGQIRGLNLKRLDGTPLRPTLVLLDDPQTDEAAANPLQIAKLERKINGTILGLAPPGEPVAMLMPCTVVCKDDLADRLLDHAKNPQWGGQRTSMVLAWPTHQDSWDKYAELRRETMRNHPGDKRALAAACNAFYEQHRAIMDEGAQVAWPEMFQADELSGLQRAWNLRIDRGEAAFFAEYQNQPLLEEEVDADLLTADQIAEKVNGLKRGEVPIACSHVTMFIDVQAKALFWLVAAWGDNFTGYVIDYGTEPDQKTAYFALRDIRRTLGTAAPGAGLEGAIYAGLERLTEATAGREWRRDDGAMVRIDRCLIDANWGQSTEVVYQFCRQSKYAGVVMPSHGRYVGASSLPFAEYKRRPGDRAGLNWRIPLVTGKHAVRHVVFDTNYWKSFVHARLAVPMGDPGCLSLFGQDPEQRRLLAEHLASEYRVKTEGRGRTVDEWKLRASGLDNHWFDGVVGCAVGASMCGVTMATLEDTRPKKRERVRFSEMQRQRKMARGY